MSFDRNAPTQSTVTHDSDDDEIDEQSDDVDYDVDVLSVQFFQHDLRIAEGTSPIWQHGFGLVTMERRSVPAVYRLGDAFERVPASVRNITQIIESHVSFFFFFFF